MAGIITAPMAAVVAGAEPLTAANTSAATMTTQPMPPGRWRTKTSATRTRRCDRPPALINSPASMKKGIASRLKLCVPATMVCGSSIGSMPVVTMTASTHSAMAKAKGTPMRTRPAKPAVRINAVVDMGGGSRARCLVGCLTAYSAARSATGAGPSRARSSAYNAISAPAVGALAYRRAMG